MRYFGNGIRETFRIIRDFLSPPNELKFKPDYTVTVGEVIGEWVDCQEMTPEFIQKLADFTGYPVTTLTNIAAKEKE